MRWNMPTYSTKDYTFGPAVIYIGATGATPSETSTNCLGAVRGNTTVTVTKSMLQIKQGSPQVVTKQYVMEQAARISFGSLEAMSRLALLKYALGAGEYTGTDGTGEETLGYGGDINIDEVAIEIIHRIPSGTTVKWRFWRCQGKADLAAAFNEGGETVVPMEFEALDGTVDFAGATIADDSKSRLFKIIKINPPA